MPPNKPQFKDEVDNGTNTTADDCEDYFEKASGTTGISGQLYETKLLTLILLRALNDDNIKEFVLGTNIAGLGALDDIVLRYELNNPQKEKIIFIQAKHRDDPNKNKLTVEDIKKQNEDFSLHKYLNSYLTIQRKLVTDKKNSMFINSAKGIESEFIIYTSAKEQFDRKKVLEKDLENVIKTSHDGVIFQYTYDDQDVEDLVNIVVKSRITHLAMALSKCILESKFQNLMLDDLMKTYHVFIAQNVINITSLLTGDSPCSSTRKSPQPYCMGQFRSDFWTTNDSNLVLMRDVIYKEISKIKGDINEVESFIKPLSFKLPVSFGNHCFHFNGSVKKQQRRLDHICSVFHKLLSSHTITTDSNYICIKVDENSFGPDKIIHRSDFDNYRLGGLVGNLLENDDETAMLKFNLKECSLSEDNILIIKRLKIDFDLSRFRFDIKIHDFPKFTLSDEELDQQLVKEFLNKLKFYTNQSKEDEVEKTIVKEIKENLKVKLKNDTFCDVKCNAIFLKVHDRVQKWWKQTQRVRYLRKLKNKCTYFQQAEREILHSPVLDIFNFIYKEEININFVEFEAEAINCLQLDWFLNSDERLMLVVSDDITFTSMKVIQYFNGVPNSSDYIFLDLDLLNTDIYLEIVKSALMECSKSTLLIVVIRETTDINKLVGTILEVKSFFDGRIVILSHKRFLDCIQSSCPQFTLLKDNSNNFSSLTKKVRDLILNERKIIFQGIDVTVADVFDNSSLHLFNPSLLRKLLREEQVTIGETLMNASFEKIVNCYVDRHVCRHIKPQNEFNTELNKINEIFIMDDDNTENVPQGITDIVLKTNKESVFVKCCDTYNGTNIHWFTPTREDSDMIWKQSHGSLENILKFIKRDFKQDSMIKLESLKDLKEKVAIISAGPGSGKSTLLTHLVVRTKREHPNLWILKINLWDYMNHFVEWNENKMDINLFRVTLLLYDVILKNINKANCIANISELLVINKNNELDLNEINEKFTSEEDLFEIKLFNHFYNNNSVAILCDGFDEVCPDYEFEVIQLLATLKTSKVAHLWITSRHYNVLERLESALTTFSYRLNPLTVPEQLSYLQKAWSFQSPGQSVNYRVYDFYSTITRWLDIIQVDFLSLPLHLYMVANIYESLFKDYVEFNIKRPADTFNFNHIKDMLNLITLYERFTNIKFYKIRFGEKKGFHDPDMKKMIEKERKLFLRNHKLSAAYSLLDINVALSDNDIKDVLEFVETVKLGEEKTGIVECIVEEKPKFVHFTFAEYFAVEHIFDKLKSVNHNPSLWEYLFNDVLVYGRAGLRRFMNSKLQNDEKVIVDEKYKKMLFELLLAQGRGNETNESSTAIDVAVAENLEHISIFLLECIEAHLTNDNLSDFIQLITYGGNCVLTQAIRHSSLRVVKLILKLITDIDKSKVNYLLDSSNKSFQAWYALCNKDTTHIVLSYLEHNSELVVDFFTRLTPRPSSGMYCIPSGAHFLGMHGLGLTCCWDFLLKLNMEQRANIFNVKDPEGQLPAHYAGKASYYDFFTEMNDLLDKKVFKTICKTVDMYGFTPICRLIQFEPNFDKLKIIVEEVYEEPDIDVRDFVYKKLPKLYPKNIPDRSWQISRYRGNSTGSN